MKRKIFFIIFILITTNLIYAQYSLKYNVKSNIDNIGPIYGEETKNTGRITSLVFPKPIIIDSEYHIKSNLFEEIPDGTPLVNGKVLYSFKIKEGVFWDDGEPLTAEDFVFTFNVIRDPEVYCNNVYEKAEPIVDMVAVGNNVLNVTFNQQRKDNIGALTFSILPKHKFVDENNVAKTNLKPTDKFFTRKPVGLGMYKIKTLFSEYVALEINEDYFEPEDLPVFEDIEVEQSDEVAIIVDTFLGEKDCNFLPDAPITRIDEIASSADYDYLAYHEYSWQFMAFNLRKPIFQDINFRTAINLAINKYELNESIYHGEAKVITGPFPPGTPAYNDGYIELALRSIGDISSDENSPMINSTIVQARTLLMDSGYFDTNNDGFIEMDGENIVLKFLFKKGVSEDENLATSLINYFAEIGIDLIPEPVKDDVYHKRVYEDRDFDICLASFAFGTDPSVYTVFHSSSDRILGNNICGMHNAEIDEKLDEGRNKADRETKFQIYKKLHEMIAEQYPGVFLWEKPSYLAYDKEIEGINSNTVDPMNIFNYINKWKIAE